MAPHKEASGGGTSAHGEVAGGGGTAAPHCGTKRNEAAPSGGPSSKRMALSHINTNVPVSPTPAVTKKSVGHGPAPAIKKSTPKPSNSKTKKTKTPARKAEVKSKAAAKAVDFAGASRVIDGSELIDHCVRISDIKDVGVQKAHKALKVHNWDGLGVLLPKLPYSTVQVEFFYAKNCRGILILHYPPYSECGPRTNLALDMHKSATDNDPEGRVIFKIKSSCILLHTYAMADWLPEVEDKYGFKDILIVDDAGNSDTVRVNNRSAVALDFDHIECFPTFDDNKINIREELEEEYGKEFATNWMLEAGRLYADLALARQRQVEAERGVKPPLFLWNAGKIDESKPYGGALIDVSNALKGEREAGRMFSSHHPCYLMRHTAMAKLSAKFADDAAMGFAQCVIDASTAMSPVAPSGSSTPADASGTAGLASAADVAAAPPPTPSTALTPRQAGFWERFLDVATPEDREQARQDMLDNLEGMREKWEAMRGAVELDESLKREGLEPSDKQAAAAAKARKSVQKWRDGLKNGRKKHAASIAAVKVVEGFEGGELEPSDEQAAAAAEALPSVQKQRDGGKNGRKKHAASIAAVNVCESLKRKGLEPSAPQAAAAAEALPSVQRQRDGSANGKRGRGRKNGRAMSTEEVLAKSAEFNARKKAKAPETRGIHVQPSGTYRVKLANLTLGNYDTEEEAARVYTIACMTRSSPDPLATEAEEIVKMRALIAHKVTARDNRAR